MRAALWLFGAAMLLGIGWLGFELRRAKPGPDPLYGPADPNDADPDHEAVA